MRLLYIHRIGLGVAVLLAVIGSLLVIMQSRKLSRAITAIHWGQAPDQTITCSMRFVPGLRPWAQAIVVTKTPHGVICYWKASEPLPMKPSDFLYPLLIYGMLGLFAVGGYGLIHCGMESDRPTKVSQRAIGAFLILLSISISSFLLYTSSNLLFI